jgi:tetratricopeptide (TPR) repeat protein
MRTPPTAETSARRAFTTAMTCAATTFALTAALYLSGGCASDNGKSAKNQAALDSYVQGVMAYQKGDTDQAMLKLREAVNKQGDLVMARAMLGDLYRQRSLNDAAREQYEVLVQLDPYDFVNHYHLGLAYQLLERLQEATVAYLNALNLKPDDAKTNLQLGSVYFQLNEPGQALKYAQRAVDADPNSPFAWVNLGLILDANQQYAKAEQAYRKSLDLDSTNTGTRFYLGENLLVQRKYPEARSVFAELVKVEDQPRHRVLLGHSYFGEGKYDDAITQYRAALKLDPNYFYALNEIGATLIADYNKGLGLDDAKRKAALEVWQQSLAINRAQAKISALVQQYSKAPMFQP